MILICFLWTWITLLKHFNLFFIYKIWNIFLNPLQTFLKITLHQCIIIESRFIILRKFIKCAFLLLLCFMDFGTFRDPLSEFLIIIARKHFCNEPLSPQLSLIILMKCCLCFCDWLNPIVFGYKARWLYLALA